MLHIGLHFIVPLAVALIAFRRTWKVAYLVLLSSLLIDLDHLLANPIYDAARCSIGFHPLHTAIPIAFYALALIHPLTRLVGIGLCLHIVLDAIDCQVTSGVWYTSSIITSH